MGSVASLPESQAASQQRLLKSPCAWSLQSRTLGPVSDALYEVSVQWFRHHTWGHPAHGRPTEVQGWQAAAWSLNPSLLPLPGSLVRSKQARTGSRQGLLLYHDGLGSHVTGSGEVWVLDRLVLEDCVHFGPQM